MGRSLNFIGVALALAAISSVPAWAQEGLKSSEPQKPAAHRVTRKKVTGNTGGVGAASSPANLNAPSTYFSRAPDTDNSSSSRDDTQPNVRPSLSSGGHVGMGIGF